MNDLQKKREALQRSYEHTLRTNLRSANLRYAVEWGPGASTFMILEECPNIELVCVEHQQKYYNTLIEQLKENGFVYDGGEAFVRGTQKVYPLLRTLNLSGGGSMGYVTAPFYILDKVDFAFVDGRQRVDCMQILDLLAGGPMTIVHDAQRANYKRGYARWIKSSFSEDGRTVVLKNKNESWYKSYSKEKTFDTIRDLLQKKTPFTFIRFGDGELFCMQKPMFANKRHQPRDDKLSKEIIKSFQIDNDKYMIGCLLEGTTAGRTRELQRTAKTFRQKLWSWSPVAFHLTFLENIYGFIELVRSIRQYKNIVLIGGPGVTESQEVKEIFGIKKIVTLSDTNAYYELDKKWDEIIDALLYSDLIIPAAGWASNCIVQRLNKDGLFPITILDIGSVLDAIAGNKTRSWITKNLELVNRNKEILKNHL